MILIGCSGNKLIIHDENGSPCLPDSEFNISGITNQSTRPFVIAQKGEPVEIESEDSIRLETLKYRDMIVEISNDHVLFLSTDPSTNMKKLRSSQTV